MTDRDEWIAERVAIKLDSETFPLGGGRWGCRITESEARRQAMDEWQHAQEREQALRDELRADR